MQKSQISIQQDPGEMIHSFLSGRQFSSLGVLTDSNTINYCYPLIKDVLPAHHLMEIPAGEEHKNLATCERVWEQLTQYQFDRHSLLVILGGGVLGDLGGFCAATYKRGIEFLLVPTTLLAQVDASVGGKLGIDFHQYKNHIGVFCEPIATLICSKFLATLPTRELRSGFAEVIKHCIISDKKMWNELKSKSLENQDLTELISHSVAFKQQVIEKDPREKGLRKILNFGHTVGHAIESYFLTSANRLFHGEAIGIGMVAEAFIAKNKNLISEDELHQITTYLNQIYPKVILPESLTEIIVLMQQDKKNKGSKILMALPEGIGQASWDVEVNPAEIEESLKYYQSNQT
jgi:3-dehydroquinate synthase